MNARLLSDTWEADRLLAGAPGPASRPAVVRWLEFLGEPTPQAWYRAHNTSIATAYLEHRSKDPFDLLGVHQHQGVFGMAQDGATIGRVVEPRLRFSTPVFGCDGGNLGRDVTLRRDILGVHEP